MLTFVGRKLDGGWTVIEEVHKDAKGTGGYFSKCFRVERKGQKAFMKALDFMPAMKALDPAQALRELTEMFIFERSLLDECKDRKMRRVVRQVGHGVLRSRFGSIEIPVQYMILELADEDFRHGVDGMANSVRVRSLQHVAVGLNQLHQIGVAHQDLKPSNVLLFDKDGARVGDLGHATRKGGVGQGDGLEVAGDPRYAPPEHLYGVVSPEFRLRRMGCDAYLMGSLIVLSWTKVSLTTDVVHRLEPHLHWQVWHGKYVDVLPHLQSAFEDAMTDFRRQLPDYLAELVVLVRELCDPDPDRRYVARSGSGLPLQRFVSRLDVLATRCAFEEQRR